MSVFGVNLELLSFDQNEALLDLLRFPTGTLRQGSNSVIVECVTRWEHRKRRFKSAEAFLAAGARRCNFIATSYRIGRTGSREAPYKMGYLWQELYISPTSDLWIPTKEWSQSSRPPGAAATFLSQEGRESVLRTNEITTFPTVLKTAIGLIGDPGRDKFGAWLAQALAGSIPQELARDGVCGCAGFVEDENYAVDPGVSSMGWHLRDRLHAMESLKRRFAALSTCMVGPLERCTALATALSLPLASVVEAASGRSDNRLAVLHIPDCILCDPGMVDRAKPFIVADDERADYQFGDEDGEYEIGFQRYRTIGGLARSGPSDAFPTLPQSELAIYPAVAEEYCKLLGVDVLDMLAEPNYPSIRNRETVSVDSFYREQPDNTPLGERVWRAYRRLWSMRWTPPSDEFINFMREHYFPGVSDD